MASPETFYPDAHVESTSVDGRAYHFNAAGLSWTDIVGEVGSGATDSTTVSALEGRMDANTDKWDRLDRNIILFDTSGLPDGATVTGVTLSLYGNFKRDPYSDAPDINIYKSTPFANTALQADDFVDIGTTPVATAITYAAFDAAGYNVFTLIDVDTDDFGYISKTSVTKLGARNANYDVAEELDPGNHAPTWDAGGGSMGYQIFTADQGDTANDPKLVVTYTAAHEKALADTVNISDSFSRVVEYYKTFTDTVNIGDAIKKAVSIIKSDAVAIADSFSYVRGRFLVLADTVGITDTLVKTLSFVKVLSDTIGITDSASKAVGIVKADTVNITDSIVKGFSLIKTDTLAIADSIAKAIGIVKTETIAIVDYITLIFHPIVLKLKERTFAFTLRARSFAFNLKSRVFALTLKER